MKKLLLLLLIILLLLPGCSAGDETYSQIVPSSAASKPQSEPSSSAPEEEPSEDESSQDPQEESGEEPFEESSEEPSEESSEESTEESKPFDWFPDDLPQEADALLYVTASGSYGTLQFYQKGENGFELILSCDAIVGAEGIGQASEWSTHTPAGLYRLRFAFGVEPDPGCPVGYVQVDETHYWVADSDSPYYNRFVSTRDVPFSWSWYEHLIDYPRSYAYAAWIEYNYEQIPGGGSAFFLHCDNGNPTAGCVAVSRENMIFILQHLTENTFIYNVAL